MSDQRGTDSEDTEKPPAPGPRKGTDDAPDRPREIGGQNGPEPTRYGDWEKNGRCTDF